MKQIWVQVNNELAVRYGRFGINPECTITEVCNRARYDDLVMRDNFILLWEIS